MKVERYRILRFAFRDDESEYVVITTSGHDWIEFIRSGYRLVEELEVVLPAKHGLPMHIPLTDIS